MCIKAIIRRSKKGFTLMEMLIAMGISGIVLALIASFTLFSSHSFSAMSNYVDLNQKSMRALDIMTREIRQARYVTAISSDTIEVIDADGNPLSFKFYGPGHADYPQQVVMIGSTAEVLLKECHSFNAVGYRRVPDQDYKFFEVEVTTDPALVKMIQIDWECYRDIMVGDKRTTESVQTAKVVLRYNPLKSL